MTCYHYRREHSPHILFLFLRFVDFALLLLMRLFLEPTMLRKSTFLVTALVTLAVPMTAQQEPARKPLYTTSSISSNGSGSGMVTAGNGMNFFFWGDWGQNVPANESESGVGYEEKKVATQVEAFAAMMKPAFFCLLGDNFYEIGVQNTTDPLWQKYYRALYTAPDTYVPWYPTLGNHDYYSGPSPQAEIDYYKERKDNRWTMPDYQYTRTWNIPGSSKTMQIVFINTPAICPEAESGVGKINWPTDPVQQAFIWQPTLQWVENTLAASTADLLIVSGHYHVYTNTAGDSLKPEGLCLQQKLVPLMKKYQVAAYMNGHEHNFEHHFIGGIHYLTVGHGCDQNDPLAPGTPPGLIFNQTIGGFGMMYVAPSSQMNFTYVDENGEFIHQYTISNPRDNALRRRALRGPV